MTRKEQVYKIIFEAETYWGRVFDIVLIVLILLSLLIVSLDSVKYLSETFGQLFLICEIILTVIFTLEYLARTYSSPKPLSYMTSFYGIVDLASILPTLFGFIFEGSEALLVLRALRLLRVFRILKLAQFVGEAEHLRIAISKSMRKISIFMIAVLTMALISGTVMYLIEGEKNGFTSIPKSVYWAIVTMTTVGYGDLSPKTNLGQAFASLIMIIGYGIIAVPTGIISVELGHVALQKQTTRNCKNCHRQGHVADATYCKYCSAEL